MRRKKAVSEKSGSHGIKREEKRAKKVTGRMVSVVHKDVSCTIQGGTKKTRLLATVSHKCITVILTTITSANSEWSSFYHQTQQLSLVISLFINYYL